MKAVDRWWTAIFALAVLCACGAGGERRAASRAAHEASFSAWGAPVNLGPPVNGAREEFAPFVSRDGRTLYFGSIRPDDPEALGGIDIYVSERESVDAPWGPPRNLGPAVNSPANDNTPVLSDDGHRLYFGSNRLGGHGGLDLYVARRRDKRDSLGWEPAVNLGPTINTAANESAPEPFEDPETGAATMYFVSNRAGTGGDIFASAMLEDGTFGPAVRVDELSSPFDDQGPDVRRDGLEVVIVSNRPGTLGELDLWIATRASTSEPWSAPVNLGPTVNSPAVEAGAAFSFDGSALYFHSPRPGSQAFDLWVTTRVKLEDDEKDEGDRDWIQQFGTAAFDAARAVAVDGPAVFVSGVTQGALPGQVNLGGQDVFVQRYDRRGNLLWTRQFGTSGTDETRASELLARHGRVYVGGNVDGALPGQTSSGTVDGFLQVFDAEGTVVWTRQLGTALEDYVRNMAVDEDGSVYVTGHTEGTLPDVPADQANPSPGHFDGFVRKLDRDGNTIWTRQFGSTGDDEPIGITLVEDRILVAGATEGALTALPNAGSFDVFVAELDLEGRIRWFRQFGSAGSESAWQVVADERAIYVAAATDGDLEAPGAHAGLFDAFLAKLSRDGHVEWIRQFGTPVQDRIYDLAMDGEGVITSGQIGDLPDPLDAFLRRYDADGNVTWHLEVAPTDLQSAALGLAVSGDDIFVAGGTQGTLPGNTRSWTGQDPYVLRISLADDDD